MRLVRLLRLGLFRLVLAWTMLRSLLADAATARLEAPPTIGGAVRFQIEPFWMT